MTYRARQFYGDPIVGQTVGRWTFIAFVGKTKHGASQWSVQCSCGMSAVRLATWIMSGRSRSCGSCAQITHGKAGTRTYRIWAKMKHRCYNPRNSRFHDYGGRGIRVCEEWRNSFETFLADMGEPPTDKHSLDRRDVNGDYNKENCRWATVLEQNNNKRVHHYLTRNGRTQKLADWTRELGLHRSTILRRLRRGMSEHDALATDNQIYRPAA